MIQFSNKKAKTNQEVKVQININQWEILLVRVF